MACRSAIKTRAAIKPNTVYKRISDKLKNDAVESSSAVGASNRESNKKNVNVNLQKRLKVLWVYIHIILFFGTRYYEKITYFPVHGNAKR